MLPYALLKHTARRSQRLVVAPTSLLLSSSNPFDIADDQVAVRCLSSSSSRGPGNRGPGRGGGRGEGGGKRWREGKKENFDRKYLLPALRGELTDKHDTGIPRLAARKPKAHLRPKQRRGAIDPFFAELAEYSEDEEDEEDEEDSEHRHANLLNALLYREEEDESDEDDFDDGEEGPFDKEVREFIKEKKRNKYFAPELFQDDKYFWREEEYEDAAPKNLAKVGLDLGPDEEYEIYYGQEDFKPRLGGEMRGFDDDYDTDDEDDDDDDESEKSDEDSDQLVDATTDRFINYKENLFSDIEDDRPFDAEGRKKRWSRKFYGMDPDEYYFYGQEDVDEIASNVGAPDNSFLAQLDRNVVLPLNDHGPDLEDFLEAVHEHPSDYAKITCENPHPESQREPKPYFPKSRRNPPEEFVNKFKRFLFVTGLPPLEVDGELGDLDNPIHASFLTKAVARAVGVDTTAVFPADVSSAFVGFKSPRALADALRQGPKEPFLSSPISISLYRNTKSHVHEFFKGNEGKIVELTNVPVSYTPASIIRDLFPVDTALGKVYGTCTPSDVVFLARDRVVIKFPSTEQAESAVTSHLLAKRLEELSEYPVRYFRARRELVHAGFTGPTKAYESRVMGPRLIVDGDMPSKTFYISHAKVIHLRNIDPSTTKEELSAIFQPFCAQLRDIEGSIEFVTCHAGLPTDCVYVGFDHPGEAEKAVEALKRRVRVGDRMARISVIQDRKVPHRPPVVLQKRPERNVEDLLDSLNNWEKYVDPKDLEELEAAGIPKVVIDEALRGFRFHNATFGPLDDALRSEALLPESGAGNEYKELVQLYISTLKECIATPENVGPLYEGLHFPDDPIDLSVFDRYKELQKKIIEARTFNE